MFFSSFSQKQSPRNALNLRVGGEIRSCASSQPFLGWKGAEESVPCSPAKADCPQLPAWGRVAAAVAVFYT